MPRTKKTKPTILVTGGAGFIGAHVAQRLLRQGFNVVIVDNFNKYYSPALKAARVKNLLAGYAPKIYRTDISNYRAVEKIFKAHKISTICHLAAQAGVRYSLSDPLVYEQSNVRGSLNLLELARLNKVKNFIFASSSSVYGESQAGQFLEQQDTDRPISIYAATKKATELLAYTYHHLYGLNCTGLRFFTVYGPWGRPDMALFKFSDNIIKGRPIEVYNYGNMERDFTYVDDIADGVISAIKKSYPWEIINLSSRHPVKLKYFIGLLEQAFGRAAKKKYLPRQPGDVLRTAGNTNKAKRLLNYKPKTPIEIGIKNFVSWYKNYYKI